MVKNKIIPQLNIFLHLHPIFLYLYLLKILGSILLNFYYHFYMNKIKRIDHLNLYKKLKNNIYIIIFFIYIFMINSLT